jgi:hypothetical protein
MRRGATAALRQGSGGRKAEPVAATDDKQVQHLPTIGRTGHGRRS